MADAPNTADLEAYLDEALPAAEMSRIEELLRQDPELVKRLAAINARRDTGIHTLGEIWRRHRLSCPPRDTLGSYLLGVLPPEEADYIDFHIKSIGCRWCEASLDDLNRRQAESETETATRRRRYFESSAGMLRKK